MGVIQEFFNNREIAIGIWVIIGLAVILPTKPARQFIKTAIPILFCKKFVIFYIVFLSFLGLVLFALNWAGLWDLTLLKDTVFWVLFVELPLFAKAIEKADGGRFFSKLIRENVAIVVAIEFFVGFWTFSLITEIILIPLTVLISVLQVLAGQDFMLHVRERSIVLFLLWRTPAKTGYSKQPIFISLISLFQHISLVSLTQIFD